MSAFQFESLASYWTAPEVFTNVVVIFNMLGALALGLVVGYERSYHGRAAGMRTYGLVCMAACALTVVAGYPHFWYGGQIASTTGADPTRVIQGIITGVGFLGAGVIMHEGLNISGLTTAASIWAASAIGIMVGIGFYASSIALTLLTAACMMWVSTLEKWLPSRPAVLIVLQFQRHFFPNEETLRHIADAHGFEIASGSMSISSKYDQQEWRFVATALNNHSGSTMSQLSSGLTTLEGVENFSLSHARN